ncbi:alpha/beta fold hydrolase [Burkholderia stagnalis]|uniref:alpha/beta fold hydrolase n=1 Tax=Burkholderia stagnalis TaxID=1503054 RepID=UPI000F57A70D|nr:alpha/beta fold hydrolase [Burkholderia stagnalis]RQQ16826.1 alpha/beta fold hydrolase [Burkholderia stagnalis]RQQ20732.1 alpha/beta fold hydrolase [Burkholderia stagnalis]RQQ35881.1 alpha/beta fold hydrolase [Burkholderia stagnalis]RQQ39539.1 alpha/beta fold hydrolase [Burkholderia stagnalis]RQQ40354.1 alpha/beta fold hydrolase [Burkholderia stagnalis]
MTSVTNVVAGVPVEVRAGRTLSVAQRAAPPGSPHAGTVVFFAHGGGGNKNQWRAQWRTLADAGYGLVAWDFLGHGDSPRPHAQSGAYHGDETLRDYLALFDRYKGTHNVLVAHSLGTGSTLALLDRLAALGRLREASGALLLGTQLARPVTRPPALPGWLLEWIKPVFARRFRRLAWHPQADPALVAYESRIARRNRMATFQAVVRDAPWPDAARLAALALPIAVLAGDSDGLTPPAGGRALADALPDATFDVLPACGHQLMLERPDAVNAALLALLDRAVHPAQSA